jgi:glyoxylase-like metal-dependent hydrolase (beta-lactamase superfamily II)
MKYSIITAFLILFISQTIVGQTDEGSSGDSKIIPVGEGIYVYKNRGGNIGLCFGNDGVFMIDTQFAEVSEDILKDVARFTDKPLKYVLNTHHHGDHTGGNANMANTGATLVSHDNVRTNLQNFMEESPEKVDESLLPTITISDELTFYFNDNEIFIRHIEKAHTNGDVVVLFRKSNVLHAGDAFSSGKYPFIDVENGGTVEGYIKGLEVIQQMCNKETKIIPGHGEVAKVVEVQYVQNMIEYVFKKIAYHHLNKKKEAEILAMTDITQAYDKAGYGDGFITREKFMKVIYDAVVAKYSLADYDQRAQRIEDIRKKQNAAKSNSEGGDKGI